ncbi:unnamed protein product, partial [Staurois parvus]
TKSGNPELHSGLPCGVAQGFPAALTLTSLPQCPSCSIPGHLFRPMPASGFHVPVPVTSGHKAAGTSGKFKNFKNCHFFVNFVPRALSCALPAF